MARTVKLATLVASAVLLLHAAPASAQQVVLQGATVVNVSATVIATCAIVAPASIGFGNIDVTSNVPAASRTGNISVRCTKNANSSDYRILLSSSNSWRMTNGTDFLPYTITHVNNVAFTPGNPVPYHASGKSAANIPVVATIAGGDLDLSVGEYSDTVTAEIQL